jgi:hypothetical protein
MRELQGACRGYFASPDKLAKIFEASSKSGQNWLKTAKFCPDKIGLLLNRPP